MIDPNSSAVYIEALKQSPHWTSTQPWYDQESLGLRKFLRKATPLRGILEDSKEEERFNAIRKEYAENSAGDISKMAAVCDGHTLHSVTHCQSRDSFSKEIMFHEAATGICHAVTELGIPHGNVRDCNAAGRKLLLAWERFIMLARVRCHHYRESNMMGPKATRTNAGNLKGSGASNLTALGLCG
ncbi:hypothetical protein NDU88_005201 [Pleurodeles waltl]|uniref:Uncharacterized protein n=1 Tax=Pleurodeles waltl TaxID=8319 RepID=A0AAV7NLS1_PLEWA|nr:hypothetical protein NDU88_005201 [Pleurodeles waltl]